MKNQLRKNLPPLPDRIASLPVSDHGYPIPYFVSYVDGKPDFRVMDPSKMARCLNGDLCWICGQKLGRHKAFSGGPLVAVSKISAEPPSHRDCAVFAAQVCPFMLLPKSKRRESSMPSAVTTLAGDKMIERNPGVTLVWITNSYSIERDGDRLMMRLSEPSEVLWYAEGEPATVEAAKDALAGSIDAALEKFVDASDREISKLHDNAKKAEKYFPK